MYVHYVTSRKNIYLFRDTKEISVAEKLVIVFLIKLVFGHINGTKLLCIALRDGSNHWHYFAYRSYKLAWIGKYVS
jgi:hypothetical protein